ncbi:Insulinase (Peptidase family M16) [Franzmannia pantelleriensis]|uniref:Insulinase (Peptidase family M16) n=1 Tax=Franzmannia pantelleriensis TaxID=48727 RepID=A0A1G9RQH3_9GAMM|nr:insulinase family protein [Halomonas pantelleriensis]SDM25443.1 Insulinase (Peptidase family M16) [Halomonas pantelleriensis]
MRQNDSDLSQGLPVGSRCRVQRHASGLWLIAAEVPSAHLARLVGAVDLGYLDEPATRPGLAHLLEHSLFLGSQRCPEPDALSRWVGEQGGRYNAYTGDIATDVHLQLPPAAAGAGLAHLCELLARPCFDPALVEREVAVLDAEFHARLADPELHRLAALGELCRPGHSARRCHAGHAASLAGSGEGLAAELRALHRHYRPRRMALAMLGPQPLEEQLALLAQHAATLDHGAPPPTPAREWRWAEPGGMAWQLPVPAAEADHSHHCLELLWPLPADLANAYRAYLDGVAARLADGALAETLGQAATLRDMQVTSEPAGSGPALSLRLDFASPPPPLSELLACLYPALNAALRDPLSPTTCLAANSTAALDQWPRRQARRLAGQAAKPPASVRSDGQAALAAWLAPDQCRLLWQRPAVARQASDWRLLEETATRVARLVLPAASPAFAPAPRQAPRLDVAPAGTPSGAYWLGRPPWPVAEREAQAISHCALSWPAPDSSPRLTHWRRRCLALGQAARAQGARLQLGGDRLGDWLIASGTPAQVRGLAEQALAAWPADERDHAADSPTVGLIAQRLLGRLESAPSPANDHTAFAPLCWASDAASPGDLLARCPALPGTPKPPAEPSDTIWLAPQASDHAVMLEVMGMDASSRSRWLLRLLGQCHDAAFQQALRQRQGLGYAAAVRYREAAGWPRLGYVVQSPHADSDTLRAAIDAFISAEAVPLANISVAALDVQRRGLLARHGPPETYPAALEQVWQTLRQAPPPAGKSVLPRHLGSPWQQAAQRLADVLPEDLLGTAEALRAGRLPRRWWYHRPAD